MPFGVELPPHLSGDQAPSNAPEQSGGAPEGSQNLSEPDSTQGTQGTPPQATPLTDLDKLDKVLFKGREWTRKEFEDGVLRQSDYTQKMQEVARERKFAEHFAYDLRTVMADRNKLAEFEKIYPKAYTDRVREILAHTPGQAPAPQTPSQSPSLKEDPEFQNMKSEFNQWKETQKEVELKQIQSWIDNQFEKFGKKYPNAHPEIVNNRAWAATQRGEKITEEVLDKLFKSNDSEMKAKTDEMYKAKITKQLKAGKEGKDVGVGGDISGGAPKKFRTIKDATKGFLDDIASR